MKMWMVPHHFYHMNFTGKENKISIILPVYNAEFTIVSSVQSVVDQTYNSWELIIIDDGSTDNSVGVLLAFISQLDIEIKNKIIFLHQENKGPSLTRNRGINCAKGNYIAFLDSDDMWTREKLDLQIKYFVSFPEMGIVGGGFNKINNWSSRDFIIISYYKLLFKNYFLTPTVMIKREFLDDEKFYFNNHKKYSEDQDLWLRIIYRKKGIYINKVLAKNIIGKANFGESGLSSNLKLMHNGEVDNLIFQYKKKRISIITLLIVISFSYLKYFRRKWLTHKKRF